MPLSVDTAYKAARRASANGQPSPQGAAYDVIAAVAKLQTSLPLPVRVDPVSLPTTTGCSALNPVTGSRRLLRQDRPTARAVKPVPPSVEVELVGVVMPLVDSPKSTVVPEVKLLTVAAVGDALRATGSRASIPSELESARLDVPVRIGPPSRPTAAKRPGLVDPRRPPWIGRRPTFSLGSRLQARRAVDRLSFLIRTSQKSWSGLKQSQIKSSGR